jgi:hypothetical protein
VVLCALCCGELMSRGNVKFMSVCMGWFFESVSAYFIAVIVFVLFSISALLCLFRWI